MTNELITKDKVPTLFNFSFNKDTDSHESALAAVRN